MVELAAAAIIAGALIATGLYFWGKTFSVERKNIPLIFLASFALTMIYPYLAAVLSFPAFLFAFLAATFLCALTVNGYETWAAKIFTWRYPAGSAPAKQRRPKTKGTKGSQLGRAEAEEIIALANACRSYLQKIGFPFGNKPVREENQKDTGAESRQQGRTGENPAEVFISPAQAGSQNPAGRAFPEKATPLPDPLLCAFQEGTPLLPAGAVDSLPLEKGVSFPLPPKERPADHRQQASEKPLFKNEPAAAIFENELAACIRDGFALKQEGNFAEAARSFLKAYKLARTSKLRIILLVELSKLYRDAGHKAQSAAVLQLLHQRWPQFSNPVTVNIDSPPVKRTE
jgi:hypothetical protein